MTTERERRLCPTCGRVAVCDEHHPMAQAHVPGFTVPACVASCHPVLTERQMIGGIVLDHDADRGDGENAWAFLRGMSDLLGLVARSIPGLGAEEAQRDERMTINLGRAIDLTLRSGSQDGIEGPNPRANDLRVAGRRHFRRAVRDQPRQEPPSLDDKTMVDRMRVLSRAMVDGQEALPDHFIDPAMKEAAQMLAGSVDALFAAIGMLDERERDADVFACIAEGIRRATAVSEKRQAAETAEQMAAARPEIESHEEFTARYLEFMAALAHAGSGDEAEQALDRLITAVIPG